MRDQLLVFLKLYLIIAAAAAVVFYIGHLLRPYGRRRIPEDFIPPPNWIGSFSKGQFWRYIMDVFLLPLSLVVTGLLDVVLHISQEIAIIVGVVLLIFVAAVANNVEAEFDGWPKL